MHQQVTEVLRHKIVDGLLPPGTPISERELCEELGVSRTPLREALKVLASEGLVQLFRNRGAIVSPLSVELIEDKFAVIAALECHAAKHACERASDEQLKVLTDIHKRFCQEFEAQKADAAFALNQDFHHMLVQMSGNVVLADMHALLSRHVLRIRKEGIHQHMPMKNVVDDQQTILENVLKHHTAAAQAAIYTHYDRVAKTVYRDFRGR
ncbi:MAG TPA: GntR family transcriptional regulator [Stellaceae bacterium]|nr:GntR family transcriptional regulator [Stellaceae bacterium]